MNESLIFILGAAPDEPVRWAFVGESGVLLADQASDVAGLSTLATRAAEARQIVAVLQGESVAMRHLPSPPRSQGQFRAAAGFLLEDELAESLDNIHLAVARHQSGAGLSLAIKKSIIEEWLGVLADAGINPDILSPDFAYLPMATGRMTLLQLPDRMICAAGLSGFALDRPLADEIAVTLAADETVSEIVIYGAHEMETAHRDDVTVDWRGPIEQETLFKKFYEGVATAPNLLQGAYRKKRDWRQATGPWRRVGVLMAASLAALLLVNVAGIIRDLRLADQLKEETLELHMAAFPDAAGADPKTYARQVLAAGGGKPAFLMISDALADSISEGSGVQIDRIRFNGERGDYSINMRFNDIAQFEAVKRSLESKGLTTAESGGVRRSGAAYLGELRVGLS
ncbi:type II secretion system protein GspL [Hyphococcus sp.]|uniref:type II secretion system protein GspL n=1 Tax=Hyphococcus sp. TaxID=2038636 RepID=UPI00208A4D29|nr:MAG: type II secretion system protein GspL [Marinicaulis sp.]